MLTLGASILVSVMAMLFALTCLFMMLVILIQKPKGGGLSGAFGGAGGSAQAAFGAKTGDLLTTITIACFVVFLGLAIGLTYAIRADVTPKVPNAVTPVSSTPATTGSTGTGAAPVEGTATPAVDDAAQPVEEAPVDVPTEAPVAEEKPADAPTTDTQP
ncbi:MAG: preprotein translocase subunit SecG [Phycisphaerales bacterium]